MKVLKSKPEKGRLGIAWPEQLSPACLGRSMKIKDGFFLVTGGQPESQTSECPGPSCVGVILTVRLDDWTSFSLESRPPTETVHVVSNRIWTGPQTSERRDSQSEAVENQAFVSLVLDTAFVMNISQDDQTARALVGWIETLRDGCCEISSRALSPQKRQIAHQILTCPLSGVCRRFFMEGKANELLAHFLSQLGVPDRNVRFLNCDDLNKLSLARQILENDLSSPPSIKTLSRHCGLNEHKLKAGFRLHFGESVGGILRKERMKQARWLLEQSDKSVSHVGNLVGYSNTSHFIEAFRKEFGFTPGQMRRLSQRLSEHSPPQWIPPLIQQ
jgi:AraC-like DNA-binding protein